MKFLTGGTGFLGSFLADQLLLENDTLFILSRATKELSVEQRFAKALSLTTQKSGTKHINLRVCEGDVTLPLFGLSSEILNEIKRVGIDELWHSAGSISFSESESARTHEVNVGGMKNLLEFAEIVQVKKIYYIGTGYSDGNIIAKTFYGEELEDFNNPYERSKFHSELLLSEWSKKNPSVKVVIFKPSIVVGDTMYGKAFNYSGYFRFMQVFHLVRRKMEKKMGVPADDDLYLPITVPGNDQAEVNVVSVDWAVDLMMAIRDSGVGGKFPIVNDHAPVYGDILTTGLKVLKIVGVKFQNGQARDEIVPSSGFEAIERMIFGGIVDYRAYTSWTYVWDIRDTIRAVGDKYKPHPIVDFGYLKIMLDAAIKNNFKLTV